MAPPDPLVLFDEWFDAARRDEPEQPEAMTLATASAEGVPSARMVLLKAHGADGFTFYSNLGSAKARDLAENPAAALLFHWKSTRRQVRISGQVERVPDDVADAYFATRPRQSRIGAWASRQSRPMGGRLEFEARIAEYAAKYAVGPIPRPDFWGGWTLRPSSMEFWEDRRFRLHMRFVYSAEADGSWSRTELYP